MKRLSYTFRIKIYIHTWNIVQSSLSWRNMKEDNSEVTTKTIQDYFKDLTRHIKHIIIDDDTTIDIDGNKDGDILQSMCPILAWKNMWYGKYKIAKHIKDEIDNFNEPAINIRFDFFQNKFFKGEDIVYFIKHNNRHSYTKNIFIKNKPVLGIDNIYMGNMTTMYVLACHFHYNLDDIIEKEAYAKISNQEYLVFFENDYIFEPVLEIVKFPHAKPADDTNPDTPLNPNGFSHGHTIKMLLRPPSDKNIRTFG